MQSSCSYTVYVGAGNFWRPSMVAFLFCIVSAPASATLIGQEITIERVFDSVIASQTTTVSSDVECVDCFGELGDPRITPSIDIGDSFIEILFPMEDGPDLFTFLFLSNSTNDPDIETFGANGYRFTNLNWGAQAGRITGITLTTNWLNISPTSDIIFTDDTLLVNFEGAVLLESNTTDGFLRIDLQVEHVSVPEPGTLALLGIGLFGMGLARRRRKA